MAIIKEQPKYTEYEKSKINCECKNENGELIKGRIISEFMGWYLVGYYITISPKVYKSYKEIVVRKTEVKI